MMMQRNFVTDCHLHWKTKFEPKNEFKWLTYQYRSCEEKMFVAVRLCFLLSKRTFSAHKIRLASPLDSLSHRREGEEGEEGVGDGVGAGVGVVWGFHFSRAHPKLPSHAPHFISSQFYSLS